MKKTLFKSLMLLSLGVSSFSLEALDPDEDLTVNTTGIGYPRIVRKDISESTQHAGGLLVNRVHPYDRYINRDTTVLAFKGEIPAALRKNPEIAALLKATGVNTNKMEIVVAGLNNVFLSDAGGVIVGHSEPRVGPHLLRPYGLTQTVINKTLRPGVEYGETVTLQAGVVGLKKELRLRTGNGKYTFVIHGKNPLVTSPHNMILEGIAETSTAFFAAYRTLSRTVVGDEKRFIPSDTESTLVLHVLLDVNDFPVFSQTIADTTRDRSAIKAGALRDMVANLSIFWLRDFLTPMLDGMIEAGLAISPGKNPTAPDLDPDEHLARLLQAQEDADIRGGAGASATAGSADDPFGDKRLATLLQAQEDLGMESAAGPTHTYVDAGASASAAAATEETILRRIPFQLSPGPFTLLEPAGAALETFTVRGIGDTRLRIGSDSDTLSPFLIPGRVLSVNFNLTHFSGQPTIALTNSKGTVITHHALQGPARLALTSPGHHGLSTVVPVGGAYIDIFNSESGATEDFENFSITSTLAFSLFPTPGFKLDRIHPEGYNGFCNENFTLSNGKADSQVLITPWGVQTHFAVAEGDIVTATFDFETKTEGVAPAVFFSTNGKDLIQESARHELLESGRYTLECVMPKGQKKAYVIIANSQGSGVFTFRNFKLDIIKR